jgi:AbrB family looped-hinge helix DNA binding protein
MKYSCVIDGRGRITIPSEIRRHLGVSAGDRIEFVVENRQIILRAIRKRPMRDNELGDK